MLTSDTWLTFYYPYRRHPLENCLILPNEIHNMTTKASNFYLNYTAHPNNMSLKYINSIDYQYQLIFYTENVCFN